MRSGLVWMTVAAFALAGFAGCKDDKKRSKRKKRSGDDEEPAESVAKEGCEGWLEAVAAGQESAALIDKLVSEKCAGTMDALAARFGETALRAEVLKAAKALGNSPAAAKIVVAALVDRENGPAAIDLAVAWKLEGLAGHLQAALKKPSTLPFRGHIVTALAGLGGQSVPVLLDLVETDAALGGMEPIAAAVKALGAVDWAKQDQAMVDRAARALVKALFHKGPQGEHVQRDARLTLMMIGPAAAGVVVKAMRGTDSELTDWAAQRSIPGWRFTHGEELATVLWDLRAPDAARTVMAAASTSLDPPPPDVARMARPRDCSTAASNPRCLWQAGNQNRLLVSGLVAGSIPSDAAVAPAATLLGRTAPPPSASQFVSVTTGLALMNTDAARAALWKAFGPASELEALATRIAALEARLDKTPGYEESKRLKVEGRSLVAKRNELLSRKSNFATALAVSLTAAEAARFKREVLSAEKARVKTPFTEAYHEVVAQCGGQAGCYTAALSTEAGRLEASLATIKKAERALEDTGKRVKQEVKDSGLAARIKAKKKEILDGRKQLRETMAVYQKLSAAMKEKRADREQVNAQGEKYNALLDGGRKLGKELDALYAAVDAIFAKKEVAKKALDDAQKAIHRLEKLVLVAGTLPDAAATSVPVLLGLLTKAKDRRHIQLVQWAVVSLYRLAKPEHAGAIAQHLAAVGPRATWDSQRLTALLARLDPAAARHGLSYYGVARPNAPVTASAIDPKKVGLVDLTGTNQLGGMGAIANILRKNQAGVSDKMAIAMAGAGTDFVMGHGSGGMGFKGTGTGGGGVGGYGRIHGLGKIDTGGGTGVHARLGRRGTKRVGKLRIGTGASTGFCKKGDISRQIRRRANSIRACYEQRLQVNPKLQGKVTARWTIGLTGRVAKASTARNTLGDGAVTGCILRVIRRMRFPKPEGGICIVQWPFEFSPGGSAPTSKRTPPPSPPPTAAPTPTAAPQPAFARSKRDSPSALPKHPLAKALAKRLVGMQASGFAALWGKASGDLDFLKPKHKKEVEDTRPWQVTWEVKEGKKLSIQWTFADGKLYQLRLRFGKKVKTLEKRFAALLGRPADRTGEDRSGVSEFTWDDDDLVITVRRKGRSYALTIADRATTERVAERLAKIGEAERLVYGSMTDFYSKGRSLAAAMRKNERASTLVTNFGDAWVNQCHVRYDQGRLQEAATLCEKAISVTGESSVRGEAHFYLGLIAVVGGERGKGKRLLEQAIAEVPPTWELPREARRRLRSMAGKRDAKVMKGAAYDHFCYELRDGSRAQRLYQEYGFNSGGDLVRAADAAGVDTVGVRDSAVRRCSRQ